MNSPVIEIIVTAKGETKIETKGFTGASCRDASAFLENALGDRAGEQLTAEFHQQASTEQRVEQR